MIQGQEKSKNFKFNPKKKGFKLDTFKKNIYLDVVNRVNQMEISWCEKVLAGNLDNPPHFPFPPEEAARPFLKLAT